MASFRPPVFRLDGKRFAALALFVFSSLAAAAPNVLRGPYLQKAAPDAVTVRWRTDEACDSRVNFGLSGGPMDRHADDPALTTEHEVRLTGLAAETAYVYDIGSSSDALASGADFGFTTPPPFGKDKPTRIWVVGDSGTANSNADAVRDAYVSFNGAQHTDVWLMLGDNAYGSGTDDEYQAAVFNTYPALLRKLLLWSTIGNHETAQLENPSAPVPYFDIFSLPTNGEGSAGAPSGTEKYYSFDYGPVHFICLDSMTSNRSSAGPMAQWLQADLEATTQKWIIAFWHHPPYTKGSHNSDTESQLIEMRENILPILEAGGVDLVLSGHSHSYERSMLINGHYGYSDTLTDGMVLDSGSGREEDTGAYRKPVLAGSAHQGAVYAVAGTSGQVSAWTGGSTADVNPTPHPVMYASLLRLGSMVIDVSGNRLDAKFVQAGGAVADSFTILKDIPNTPPSVTITSVQSGSVLAEHSDLTIAANALDSDGTIKRADFYVNGVLLGSANAAPYSVTWSDLPLGEYTLTVAVTDNLGATVVSEPVTVSVIVPPSPPSAPTGLTAVGDGPRVALSWTAVSGATSYTVKRADASGGPYFTVASGLKTTEFADASVPKSGFQYYVVTAGNLGGEGPASSEASAAIAVVALSAATNAELPGEPPGTAFRTFGSPSVNDAGQLAFLASLASPTGNFTAVVAGKPLAVVARTGGNAPGINGARFISLRDPALNGLGQVAFLARVAGGGVPSSGDEGIWSNRSGTLQLAARKGEEPPGVPLARWKTFSSMVLGDNLLAFTAVMATGFNGAAGPGGVTLSSDTGLWIADGASTRLALRKGQPLTLSSGNKTVKAFLALQPGVVSAGQGYRPEFNSVLARVLFTDASQAVLSVTASGVSETAATGMEAPGYAAGSKLGTFGMPTPTDDGAVFLTLLQAGAGNVSGANNYAIYKKGPAGLDRVTAKGDAAPGVNAGAVFYALKDPVGASGLRAAFAATVRGGGVGSANDQGVWWRRADGTIALAAREGAAAPGAGTPGKPGLFYAFTSLALPEAPNAGPLFTARLRIGSNGAAGPGGVTTRNDFGLWGVDSAGALILLLRENQPLAGKTVKSFTVLNKVAGTAAQTRGFNNAPRVVARVYFTDGTQGIATVKLP